jgi:hypothetical protein
LILWRMVSTVAPVNSAASVNRYSFSPVMTHDRPTG